MYNQLVRGSIRENYEMKGNAVDHYETLNEVLVKLFRDIMDIEQKAIITQEFKDITNNDMHVIEAIGIEAPKNMSSIARELSVTVGTLTIAMNSLVKKGYVERTRGWKTGGSCIYPFQKKAEKLTGIMPSSTRK